jgi:hypothetical protein
VVGARVGWSGSVIGRFFGRFVFMFSRYRTGPSVCFKQYCSNQLILASHSPQLASGSTNCPSRASGMICSSASFARSNEYRVVPQ